MSSLEEMFTSFIKTHLDRLVFMGLALGFAFLLYNLEMQAESKTIFIGLAMLCYNKARGVEKPK